MNEEDRPYAKAALQLVMWRLDNDPFVRVEIANLNVNYGVQRASDEAIARHQATARRAPDSRVEPDHPESLGALTREKYREHFAAILSRELEAAAKDIREIVEQNDIPLRKS